MTASPTATFVTAEPISATQPAFSCPSVTGIGNPLSMRCRSVRHSRAPPTFTMTSHGPSTSGSATSSTFRRRSSAIRTAFMSVSLGCGCGRSVMADVDTVRVDLDIYEDGTIPLADLAEHAVEVLTAAHRVAPGAEAVCQCRELRPHESRDGGLHFAQTELNGLCAVGSVAK